MAYIYRANKIHCGDEYWLEEDPFLDFINTVPFEVYSIQIIEREDDPKTKYHIKINDSLIIKQTKRRRDNGIQQTYNGARLGREKKRKP